MSHYIDLLHSIFLFLGTTGGELAKISIELVFFTVLTYMIISAYIRTPRKDFRFLIVGFGAMLVFKLLAAYMFADSVFGNSDVDFSVLRTFENFAEVMALFLIGTAFYYPIIAQRRKDLIRQVFKNILYVLAISFVFSLVILSVIDIRGGNLDNFWTHTGVNVSQIVVLIFYASIILASQKQKVRYRYNIVAALAIYSITPTIELINILLYANTNKSLVVASHPFPFVAILIFTQVIYLMFADKAKILDRLRKSERLYRHEKEISEMKDSFISTVSHELKTPLTSMKLYIGLLRDNKLGKVFRKQKQALNVVNDECDRLNGLITDILDLSKLDAGKQKLELSEFNISEIVTNELYLSMAKKKNVLVQLEMPDEFTVVADKQKFKQVFINLFNNAIKFTPENGKITIIVEDHGREWEFAIQDTGKGISKEHIPKLFNRFYQAEDLMTRTQGGFGLGLAIVKSIVDMHGGKIKVDSEINKGTRIAIFTPKLSMY